MGSTIGNCVLSKPAPTTSGKAKETPKLMQDPTSAKITGTSYKINCGHRIEVDLSLVDANGKKQKIELTWPFKAFRDEFTGANDVKLRIHTDEPEAKNPHLEAARNQSRRLQLERLSGNQRDQVRQHQQRQSEFEENIRLRSGSWSASQNISAKDLPAAVKSALIAKLKEENPTYSHKDYLSAATPEVGSFLKALQA